MVVFYCCKRGVGTLISQRIKELRTQNNISQKELSIRLYVTPQAISKWERDEATPNPEAIAKMAKIFNVSADYLLGLTEQKETPIPVSEDGLDEQDRQLMELMKKLSADQKQFLLAQLLTLTGQGK